MVQLVDNNVQTFSGLSGITITGGELNGENALLAADSNPTASASTSPVNTNTTGLSVSDSYGALDSSPHLLVERDRSAFRRTGGWETATGVTIDTSLVTNPAPQAVYQSVRYENPSSFSYTIPNLIPGASYNVRLDFAEIYYPAAGDRLLDVSINGVTALTNFDI